LYRNPKYIKRVYILKGWKFPGKLWMSRQPHKRDCSGDNHPDSIGTVLGKIGRYMLKCLWEGATTFTFKLR
jgi:hypothetical protein